MLYKYCAIFNNNSNNNKLSTKEANLIKQNYKTEETAAQIIKNQLNSSAENEKIEEIKRKRGRFINVEVTSTMWDVPLITNRKILANGPDILSYDNKELHTDRCSHTR